MIKLSILIFTLITLQGCTTNLDHSSHEESNEYFQDASNCSESSQEMQTMNVPTGVTQTTLEIPIELDKGKYIECMKLKGWNSLPTKTFEVENLKSHCKKLNQENPDSPKNQKECLENNKLNIEVITNP